MPELKRHIWLCGFMGCGKSTVGKRLAKLCGTGFYDMDALIEQQEQLRIPEIFARFGESRFREMETAMVTRLNSYPPSVIATGGGVMVSSHNAAEAKKRGLIVLLDIPFEVCYERISHSDRPIVRTNSPAQLQQLYQNRRSQYIAHADLVFGQVLPPLETAQMLASEIALL